MDFMADRRPDQQGEVNSLWDVNSFLLRRERRATHERAAGGDDLEPRALRPLHSAGRRQEARVRRARQCDRASKTRTLSAIWS